MALLETIKNNKQTIVMIKLLLATFLWGGTFVAGKIVTPYVTPSVIGFMRFLFASIFLICILKKQGFILSRLNVKQFFEILFLALTGSVIYNIAVQIGLHTVDAMRASLIVTATPLVVTLGALIFFKEKLTFIQAVGLAITTLGAVIIITNGEIKSFFMNTGFSYGDIAVFISMLSWASYVLAGKLVLSTLSPIVIVTWATIFATIILFPFTLYDLYFYENTFNTEVVFAALYLGIFGTGVAFIWFYEAIEMFGAARTSIFHNFEPVAAVSLAIIFLGEKLTLAMFFGGILSAVGVYLANQSHLVIKHSKKLNAKN